MQGIEVWQAEAVWTLEQMQQLSHELRRADAFLVPGVREHQEIGADELQLSAPRRLVDHNLGLPRIALPLADEPEVDIVKAHRARVRAADATKQQVVTIRFGGRYVMIFLGRFAHDLDQVVLIRAYLCRQARDQHADDRAAE